MTSALKRTIIIFLLTGLALFISLPKEIPVKFSLGGISVDEKISRPNLNISYKNIKIQKEFDLVLGLDLAGGSHLVFEADTANVTDERKERALVGVRDVIERRVNLFGVAEPLVQV